MDRDERKAFFKWLNTAADRELQQKLLELAAISHLLTESHVISEFNWIKRQAAMEIDARRQCEDVRKLIAR